MSRRNDRAAVSVKQLQAYVEGAGYGWPAAWLPPQDPKTVWLFNNPYVWTTLTDGRLSLVPHPVHMRRHR